MAGVGQSTLSVKTEGQVTEISRKTNMQMAAIMYNGHAHLSSYLPWVISVSTSCTKDAYKGLQKWFLAISSMMQHYQSAMCWAFSQGSVHSNQMLLLGNVLLLFFTGCVL